MRALAHLNKYLWHYKWRIFFGIIFIIASNIFAIYAPRMIREAFDLIAESIKAYQTGNYRDFELTLPETVRYMYALFNMDDEGFKNITSTEQLAKVITQLSMLLAGLYLLAAVLKGVFLFFTRQTIIIMSRLVEFDLKNEIFDHYQSLSLAFYKRNNTG